MKLRHCSIFISGNSSQNLVIYQKIHPLTENALILSGKESAQIAINVWEENVPTLANAMFLILENI